MCIAVDTTIILFLFFFFLSSPSTIIAVVRFVFLPLRSLARLWRSRDPGRRHDMPLPLVFRNSLNKQAPIKVPRYIVHLEVGTISHGASANHFPSRLSARHPLCHIPFLSLFFSLSFARQPLRERVQRVSRNFSYPPTVAAKNHLSSTA